jgi:hypothetical protein
MGNRSVAWKALEREVALELGGKRVTRGGDFSQSDVDVNVADLPMVKVDAKYRVRHAHHSLLDEVEAKYCKAGDIPLLATKTHRQRGAYASVPLWFMGLLFNLLRQAHGEKLGAVLAEAIRQRHAHEPLTSESDAPTL